MKTNISKLRTYVRPVVTALHLDYQSVLASSNPLITNPSMPWESNDNYSASNSTVPWGAQKKSSYWDVAEE